MLKALSVIIAEEDKMMLTENCENHMPEFMSFTAAVGGTAVRTPKRMVEQV